MHSNTAKIIKYITLALALTALFTVIFARKIADNQYESSEPIQDTVSKTEAQIKEPYSVELISSSGDTLTVSENDTEVTLSCIDYFSQLADNADKLNSITRIILPDDLSFTVDDVASLQASFPSAEISYSVTVNGDNVPLDITALNLSSLPADDIEEVANELKKLPKLEYVSLNLPEENSEDGITDEASSTDGETINSDNLVFSGVFSLEQVGMLESACPNVTFDYQFSLFGKTVSTADERIEFEGVSIGDEGVNTVIRSILPYLGKLNYLKLDKCDVSSETMASLRDDFPNIKVVWRVYFSAYGQCGDGTYAVYNTLTDAEKIWATGCVTDHFAEELKYCTDVKYLDLGHNCITNIDFVNYMPNLEVAVLSISWIASIEPLTNCPNLEYLEIFSSKVTDITPLSQCKNLKHLNISNLSEVTDISCLYDLELERLYCTMSHIPQEQQDEFKSLHPDCECEFGWVDPSKGYWRYIDGNYLNDTEDNYVERYALLRKQFNYASFEYSK